MSETDLHNLYNRARIDDRQVNELVGLARGVIADGVVTQAEAEFLQKWLAANTAASDNPVIGRLLDRVSEMLRDESLDDEEAQELLQTLERFSGGDFELGELLKSSNLPLDRPPPPIAFNDTRFCFTGTFAFGSRKDCEREAVKRGANVGSLTKQTHYLVIGIYATDSWAHSSFGRKIEKAVNMREKGQSVAIVKNKIGSQRYRSGGRCAPADFVRQGPKLPTGIRC